MSSTTRSSDPVVTLAGLLVAVLGVGLTGGIAWLYLFPVTVKEVGQGGRSQEIPLFVGHGIVPDTIVVEINRPVRLIVHHTVAHQKPARFASPRLKIDRPLAPGEITPIEFTVQEIGDYPFAVDGRMAGCVAASAGLEKARNNLGKGHAAHG